MPKKIPMRMCVVCRQMMPKSTLLRIVKTPEGEIKLDFSGKTGGRGAYICDNEECIRKCIRKKTLNYVFKTEISEDIYQYIGEEYAKHKSI